MKSLQFLHELIDSQKHHLNDGQFLEAMNALKVLYDAARDKADEEDVEESFEPLLSRLELYRSLLMDEPFLEGIPEFENYLDIDTNLERITLTQSQVDRMQAELHMLGVRCVESNRAETKVRILYYTYCIVLKLYALHPNKVRQIPKHGLQSMVMALEQLYSIDPDMVWTVPMKEKWQQMLNRSFTQ